MKCKSEKEEFIGRLKHGNRYDRIKYYQKLREAVDSDNIDLSSDILLDIVKDSVGRESK